MDSDTPLGENRILQSLPAAELAELKPHLEEIAMVSGTMLLHPGEDVDFVYFPISGMISLLTVMKTGRQIETGIVGRSGVVGATIGNSGPRAFGQATVQIEGHAYRLPSEHFIALIDKSTALRRLVNEYDGYLYFLAMQSAACHAAHSVQARLCRWILQCQDVLQLNVIGLTDEFVSHMLGVTQAEVAAIAADLEKAGLVAYSHGNITVLDRDGLKEASCECYQTTHEYTQGMWPPSESA